MSVARPYNFSAGPAILPMSVFEETADAVRQLNVPGDDSLESKLSILEISHRSDTFDTIHNEAIALVHAVLGVPDDFEVLLLQGGASLQFAMLPMNFHIQGKAAAYVDTGAWSDKAIKESKGLGETLVVASSKATTYDHIPAQDTWADFSGSSYLHVTSNNTIYGTEFAELPDSGDVPLIVDLSSNIGSRPMAMEKIALGYAGAQKNLGPSGVTLVFARKDLLAREAPGYVPTMLRYRTHVETNSLFNTPNTFGILVLRNVLRWVQRAGGVEAVGKVNAAKARKLYAALDGSSLFTAHAKEGSRSQMNVTWTLGGEESDAKTESFLVSAEKAGFSGLKGHRSVGGCRASIYNAFPEAGVDALVEFMAEFERTQG
jgi:phosphoserine aminotransferase